VDPGGRVGISTFLKAPISKDLENVEGFIIPDKLLSVGIRRISTHHALDFHTDHNSRVITNVELKTMGPEKVGQVL
jgi:hypothetical protein